MEKRCSEGKGREVKGKVKGRDKEGMWKISEGEAKGGKGGREGVLEAEGKGVGRGRRQKPGWGHRRVKWEGGLREGVLGEVWKKDVMNSVLDDALTSVYILVFKMQILKKLSCTHASLLSYCIHI